MNKIEVLGPIRLLHGSGQEADLGGQQQRLLLALLAAGGSEGLSGEALAEEMWAGTEPPQDPAGTVRVYVRRLRQVLGDEAVVTLQGRYGLNPDLVELDAQEFEAAVVAARSNCAPETVVDSLTSALRVWRGPAYGDLADRASIQVEARRLDELRGEATEKLLGARLAAGRATEVVPDAEAAATAFPLRDRVWDHLAVALYRSGRQADALRALQRHRDELAEIGLEPSAHLQQLESRIVVEDASLLAPAPPRGRHLRGYQILERLGEGAFSIVYRGTQPSVDRDVAIKQIRAELANRPEFIRRFEAEAHLVARLEHPHIVPLHDYWREPNSAYLVMRLLPAGSLESAIAAGPLSAERVEKMVSQVGSALATAHRAGVVHRDVKPANILFDDDDNAYLTDFGIALEATELADPEAALSAGSPAYASPEQLRREPVGPSADVHGLAVAAYEALTGHLPFPDEPNQGALLQRQLHDPIPSLRDSRPDLAPTIDEVLARATAKDPELRTQTVGELVAEFTAAISGATDVSSRGPRGDVATLISGEARNPYKGLRAFDEADASDFAGRVRLVDQLVTAVGIHRLVAVVGPSGSGKSSVVRAGLLPALRAGAVPGSQGWFMANILPGTHPFEELDNSLMRVASAPPADLLALLRSGDRGLARAVKRILPDDTTELLLVIDQFEELFTLCADGDERREFIAALAGAVTDERARLRVVLTLRADFFDRPLRHNEIAGLVRDATVPVLPLAPDELERAIVDPGHRVGLEFEPGLVSEMVADVNDQPGALPMLQYALTELYDRQISGLVTLDAYRDLGGVSGALAATAEQLYGEFGADEAVAARRLFGRLVTLGEGIEDTRRRVRRSELSDSAATSGVIDRFGQARLLSFDRDPSTREPTVEVAHEALIKEWSRLRSWLDDDRDSLRIHRHLTASTTAWVDGDRDDSELYRGARLETAESLLDQTPEVLNPLESEFLQASAERRNAEELVERNRIRRLRRLLVTTGIVAVVALVAGAFAFREQQRADDQAALATENEALATQNAEEAAANEARAIENEVLATESAEQAAASAELADQRAHDAETARLVATAQLLAPTKPREAMLLAVAAHQREQTPQTVGGLHAVLSEAAPVLGYLGWGTDYRDVAWLPSGNVVGIRQDGLDLFDRDSGELLDTVALRISQTVSDTIKRPLGASGGSDLLAVASAGTTVHAFTVTDRLERRFERSLPAPVVAVAVAPDDGTVIATSVDGTVATWSPDGEERLSPFKLDVPANKAEQFFEYLDGPLFASGFQSAAPVLITPIAHDDHIHLAAGAESSIVDYDGVPLSEPVYTYSDTGAGLSPSSPLAFLHPAGNETIIASPSSLGRVGLEPETGNTAQVVVADGTGGPAGDHILRGVQGKDGLLTAVLDDGTIVWFDPETGARVASIDLGIGSASSAVSGPEPGTVAIASERGIVLMSLNGQGPITTAVPRLPAQPQLSISHDGRFLVMGGAGLPTPITVYERKNDGGYEALDDFPVAASIYAGIAPTHQGSPLSHRALIWGEITDGSPPETGTAISHGLDLDGPDAPVLDLTTTAIDGLSAGDVDPQGRWTVSDSLVKRRIHVYDTRSAEIVEQLPPPPGTEGFVPLSGIRFHPSGDRLLISARNGQSDLRDTSTWTRVEEQTLLRLDIALGYWNADGSLLATAASDGQVTIRDGETFEPIRQLVGALGTFNNWAGGPLLFSSDSSLLLTDHDNVARLWDVATGQQIGIDMPTSDDTNSGVNHGESLQLVTGGEDSALIWNLDPDSWVEVACRAAGSNLTAGEWEQWGPRDEDHRAICDQFPLPE